MNERDRVLEAFRNCITEPKCKNCPWIECNTFDNGNVEIPRDLVLAVMRELVTQEPVVMAGAELTDAELIDAIRKAPITLKPAVDAAPVVHGNWIECYERSRHYYCSNCGKVQGIASIVMKYCPECGAKMAEHPWAGRYANQSGAEYADNPTV